MEGGNSENPKKTPRSRDENQQQTQPTCDAGSRNRTRATAVGGGRSRHYAILVPPNITHLERECQPVALVGVRAPLGIFVGVGYSKEIWRDSVLFSFGFGVFQIVPHQTPSQMHPTIQQNTMQHC